MNEKNHSNNVSKNHTSEPPLKRIKTDQPSTSKSSHWSQGLKQTLQDKSNILRETEHVYIIKDKYPKAKYHYLVIAKGNISSVKSLNSSHIDLLINMIAEADIIEKDVKSIEKNIEFKRGFHAVPSMTLMHMHVISTDFDSEFMRHKKHWNSFTTPFFRPVEYVLEELKANKSVFVDTFHYKQMLELELKCHVCHEKQRNMPRLKEHVRKHFNRK